MDGQAARLADLAAGLSMAGLLLPEAVAYSGLASLPPAAGVIGLFAGLLCYALVGRSRFAIVSATSSSAAVLAGATLALDAESDASRMMFASLLVVGAGVVFLLASAARLGVVSNLIARPVLRGFSFGLALVIVLKQIPALAALRTSSGDFFPLLGQVALALRDANPAALTCGLVALAGLFALERVRLLPGALLVIVAGIIAAPVLSMHGVALTGPIHLQPHLPAFEPPSDSRWPQIVAFSLALMFILYAESYSSIRAYALKHNDPVQPNRDLLALGIANVVSGLFQGTPVGAGYSATSANENSGAQTRLAGLIAAATVLVLVLTCLRFIERIPVPVLAAVVIHAVSKSLRPGPLRIYFQWHRDRLISLIAIIAVLVFGMLNGLLFAIAFSIAMLLHSLTSPRLSELGRLGEHDFVNLARFAQARRSPGFLVLRPEAPLIFANAEPIMALIRARAEDRTDLRVVVLNLEESPDLDGTTVENLADLAAWLAQRGVELRPARLEERAREVLLRARIAQLPAGKLEFSSVDDAVAGRLPADVSRA